MASTYTGLGVELQATGENAGTWGTKTNTNLQILEQISGGFTQQALTSGGTVTLTASDGSTGATLAHRMIEFTGTISDNAVVTIPLDVQTFYILRNSSSGAYTVQFKYASGSGDSFTFTATNKGDQIVFASANDGTNPDIITVATGIASVEADTSPQLGGNLDVQAREINTSTTNGNVILGPNGTGLIEIKGATNPGSIQLNCESNSHGIKLQSPPHSASQSYTIIYPTGNVTAGTFLKVDSITGSGTTAVGQLTFDSSPINTGKAIAMALIFG